PGVVRLAEGEAVHVYKTVPLAQNRIDKGSAAQAIARGLAQGVYNVLLGRQRAGTGSTGAGGSVPTGTGGTGGAVGDQKADPPPPPPPPPASAPPPPPPPQQ